MIRGAPPSVSEVDEGAAHSSKWSESAAGSSPAASSSRASGPRHCKSNARVRVTKLEAAMAAIGESDPVFPALQDALKTARALAQLKPVQDRILGTESFLERARKRVVAARQDVEKAKEAVVNAEGKFSKKRKSAREKPVSWHCSRR